MKILVGFKRVLDYNLTARAKADGSDVDLAGMKMSANPFDEIALEEALKLKEAGKASEVIVFSVGEAKAADTLRTALAMGADKAIHVPFEGKACPFGISKAIAKLAKETGAELVLLGKQAIDSDHGQTPSQVAELLDWPAALNAYKFSLEDNHAEVVCEIDGGLETIAFDLPAVVSVDLRLNKPRFVSMPNIIKARSKPIETVEMEIASTPFTLKGVEVPPQERQNVMFETPEELAAKLEDVL